MLKSCNDEKNEHWTKVIKRSLYHREQSMDPDADEKKKKDFRKDSNVIDDRLIY